MKRYKATPLELIKVSEAISKRPLCSPQAVYEYMQKEALADREIFWVLHVNTKNKVVKKEMTAMGCADSCRVMPGLVLRGVVASGAPSIITVHNHPSGETNPSPEDRQLWGTMREACQLLGIRVLDNMVIGSSGYYSEEENK
ncbi:MAG: hypothetical protein A2509_03640 [Candidatus Edwardsbacteria bacterium RIFOXYD12_FULL_50_11]|uniref:MPN domain-containing protein n=1 Tax=Candidatus Edwardsbacteria bacterium GWF2_54_11 TaxID=1817851 RepID=A0A1F5R7X1_9BACT|nr:MAG: hypothetical protein A2502_03555 [Candidatus Edwardsbacteria bacterium RifOxyC12_full_54_24]OGF07789.1 MAG: hypothetical protein A2273_04805 [Candidatus Edwardsbacteria bacterium RifOxyA12_full_54_48]OGF10037.1 MAG: hypothetical protein A3K15_11215 [Candidatus Edwardsbacteria bacterium GWE2_54_12]OGF10495.1 MAG: hypothetical protein A2024_09095 [Candidatus Edwardsbacteria bacterium GWF2_54_11]OGF14949.1 MAG: hypothetical protein A2509_03640 [Candidatus Edwardsbacteria bacterium RIFOXYD1